MRLRKQEGRWIPQFSQPWEVTTLTEATEAGFEWMRFAVSRQVHPIGEIHTQVHTIRFFDDEPATDSLVVSLLPTT